MFGEKSRALNKPIEKESKGRSKCLGMDPEPLIKPIENESKGKSKCFGTDPGPFIKPIENKSQDRSKLFGIDEIGGYVWDGSRARHQTYGKQK